VGDHSGFLATNLCHTYKRVSTNCSNRILSPSNKKQLMAIVAGLKLNKNKNNIIYRLIAD